MKLPRDIGGEELANLLSRYGYHVTRQTGSHLRLTVNRGGRSHHITIPKHSTLRTGALAAILRAVAFQIERGRRAVIDELFGGE